MLWDRHHLVSVAGLDREDFAQIYLQAFEMKDRLQGFDPLLRELPYPTVMCTFFAEPSTRTRVSFEMAMLRLGGLVVSTPFAKAQSSMAKGESLLDTVITLEELGANILVMRVSDSGAFSEDLLCRIEVPLISGGDGTNEHPTQALLDVFTIQNELNTVDSLTIGMVGDLRHGRTVHSLAKLLAKFNDVKFCFVSPESLRMPPEIVEFLQGGGFFVYETEHLEECIAQLDVLYLTRLQAERFPSPDEAEAYRGKYVVDPSVAKSLQPHARILHPLPHREELSVELYGDPRLVCFRQVRNGLAVRMALLKMILLGK